ncbi:phosphoribosyltransferase-like protein [Xylariaceae sp. FL1019]|nr:phosphoribosyltransferase-like protein [Xylariaceae sp. FL1019]
MEPELIFLVTGEAGAGKDFCADVWAKVLDKYLKVRVTSISHEFKCQYAKQSGADLQLLLNDRAYKEKHRPMMNEFLQKQILTHPQLFDETLVNAVHGTKNELVDVLFITGMREEAPVAALSHMVPDSRVIEVYVHANRSVLEERRKNRKIDDGTSGGGGNIGTSSTMLPTLNYTPTLIFDNSVGGDVKAKGFVMSRLHPFLSSRDLRKLASMVRLAPDFPRQSINFHHVLGIAQQQGGLQLCVRLIRDQFAGEWKDEGAIACCEAGGVIFASALATSIPSIPLVLIREAGKLVPPTVSVVKPASYISSSAAGESGKKTIELERDAVRSVIQNGTSVMVVDDLLATGTTLCATLELLQKAGISSDKTTVMVVVELPEHRAREAIVKKGFGKVKIQSLLVYSGH